MKAHKIIYVTRISFLQVFAHAKKCKKLIIFSLDAVLARDRSTKCKNAFQNKCSQNWKIFYINYLYVLENNYETTVVRYFNLFVAIFFEALWNKINLIKKIPLIVYSKQGQAVYALTLYEILSIDAIKVIVL